MRILTPIVAFILALCLVATESGCGNSQTGTGTVTVDPTLIPDTVDAIADIAESYVILFVDPEDQPKLLAEIELARKAADLPALRRLLDRLKGENHPAPATQPAQ